MQVNITACITEEATGKYEDQTGQPSCSNCYADQAGYYQNQEGQTSCAKCPRGTRCARAT